MDLILISFDIEKAFDSVWREGLIHKLHFNKKLTGPLLATIMDFLNNRSFSAKLNNLTSNTFYYDLGVPQGCVLSPTLFNSFIDDLFKHFLPSIRTLLYADDSAIYAFLPRQNTPLRTSILNDIQTCIHLITDWCNK